jgi:probable aminopeptidase NPEPL1
VRQHSHAHKLNRGIQRIAVSRYVRAIMRIHFAAGTATISQTAPVLVVARASFFGSDAAKFLIKQLGSDVAKAVRTLGQRTKPGLLGATGTTVMLDGKEPRDVAVGVLADAVADHNSPTRAESVRKVVAAWAPVAAQGGEVLMVLEDETHLLAAANAIARAMPLFQRKAQNKQPRRDPAMTVRFVDEDGASLTVPGQVEAIVDHARRAALLVDMPPSELDPAKLTATAREVLSKLRDVKIQVIEGKELLRRGFGGIHAVGRAAKAPPRMLVATAKAHNGGKHPLHVALVGKGVTYDTGGLHLKARGMMEGMKSDMGGAAAMLGAFAVLAQAKLPIQLTLVLCIVENAIGPDAFKPDDILTMHSGKTVEINNTDAEGRLILADGLSHAALDLGAEILIDAATLTGAQLIATGNLHAAVVTNDQKLQDILHEAGKHTGDLTWPLPFVPEFYKAEFASPVADMRNSVKNRSNAQSSCAATFIHWHIEETKARWAHIDLAGPAFVGDRGTGFGVALVVDAVQRLAKAEAENES